MGKKRILFLKVVAYDSLNGAIKEYLDGYKDEKTEITVRSLERCCARKRMDLTLWP